MERLYANSIHILAISSFHTVLTVSSNSKSNGKNNTKTPVNICTAHIIHDEQFYHVTNTITTTLKCSVLQRCNVPDNG